MPHRRLRLPFTLAAIFAFGFFARDWLRLGWQAWDYPVASASARTQPVVMGERVFFAAGADGIDIVDAVGGRPLGNLPIGAPLDRVDDLAAADGLLFALDATPPGFLQTYRIEAGNGLLPSGPAVPVEVGPFSGVSAAAGVVVVSGGTSRLSAREYAADGRLGDAVAHADYGRGQPDVSLREDGRYAVVSTHLVGPRFGLTMIAIERAPLRLHEVASMPLPDAGFTAGGHKPAHFPIVVRWRDDRVFVADGNGLSVVDAADPAHLRLLYRDTEAAPAMDLALVDDLLLVAKQDAQAELLTYRIAPHARPVALWRDALPPDVRVGGVAATENRIWLGTRDAGWHTMVGPPSTPPGAR